MTEPIVFAVVVIVKVALILLFALFLWHLAVGKMMTRIVVDYRGQFWPQVRKGYLGSWEFWRSDADAANTFLTLFVITKDPNDAARFGTLEDARAFEGRVLTMLDQEAERIQSKRERMSRGIDAKRTVK